MIKISGLFKKIIFLAGLLSVMVVAAMPVQAATLDVRSSNGGNSVTVQSGNSFTLDIRVTDAADLYALQFDLSFDPTVLAASAISESAFLAQGGATFFIPGIIDATAGTIRFTADILQGPLAGVSGTGNVASVSLNASALGNSSVTLGNIILLNSQGAPLTVSTQGTSVTVAAAPPPPAVGTPIPILSPLGLLAFCWGLIMLMARNQKRRFELLSLGRWLAGLRGGNQ